MSRVIVTVAHGSRKDVGKANEEHLIGKNFRDNIPRFRKSFLANGAGAQILSFVDTLPEKSPTHEQKPYAFKYYAIREAQRMGHTSILWADSSVYAIRDLELLWRIIEWQGFLFSGNSCGSCGEWTADSALGHLQITREEAFRIPQITATAFGLDLKSNRAQDFFLEFGRLVEKTDAICGPAVNDRQQASKDPRVLGHRFDQTIASVIIHKLNLPVQLNYTVWSDGGEGEMYYRDKPFLRNER